MNILVNKLPTKVHINGEEFSVNYGFKAFILIELCFSDKELTDVQKEMSALNLFYEDKIPSDINKAFEKLLWFYRCGQKDEPVENNSAMRKQVKSYDFNKDQKLILSAFMQQYNINLNEIESRSMHWWTFRALFEGLNESCNLSKIIGFRTMDLKGMKGSQLKYYQKMKKLYSLEEKRTVDNQIALAQRNAKMKAYIKKRFEETSNE